MKYKLIRFLLWILFYLLLASLVILMLPLGKTTFESYSTEKKIEVPLLSIYKEEYGMYHIHFYNIRSVYSLQKEMKKIVSEYEEMNCNNQVKYYNAKEDYTMEEYQVEDGFFFNKISITYRKGNSCAEKET